MSSLKAPGDKSTPIDATTAATASMSKRGAGSDAAADAEDVAFEVAAKDDAVAAEEAME